jgi:cell division transport system permease protein
MRPLIRRTWLDLCSHKFLNLITVVTVALSMLIVSAFFLFAVNTGKLLDSWRQGVRVMIYLKDGLADAQRRELEQALQQLPDTSGVEYIPRKEALQQLRDALPGQASIFSTLRENPLPDAFELRVAVAAASRDGLKKIAARILALQGVADVEYGQQWLERFANITNLLKLVGYTMGALFLAAVVFIVANTIRLLLYSRRDEIEVMRLVGATDGFINMPFYLQGLIQGVLGGIVGVAVLYLAYLYIAGSFDHAGFAGFYTPRFLSASEIAALLLGSAWVGWFGCFLSLKQFSKLQEIV